MDRLTRPQLAAYAAIALAVLVLGGRWLLQSSSGGGTDPFAAGEGAAAGAERVGAPSFGGHGTETTASGEGAAADATGGPSVSTASRAALVHVAGAVRHPGVYRLAAGARVRDAVRRAGGATRRGDANAINLAAQVQDGGQIIIPRRAPSGVAAAAVAAAPGADPSAVPAAPINLNTATAEQLETLDGVGPATAAKIIDYRTQHGGFRTVDDLTQVSGIGPKRLAALRDHVVV